MFYGASYGGFGDIYGEELDLNNGVVPTLTATATAKTAPAIPFTAPEIKPEKPVTQFIPRDQEITVTATVATQPNRFSRKKKKKGNQNGQPYHNPNQPFAPVQPGAQLPIARPSAEDTGIEYRGYTVTPLCCC